MSKLMPIESCKECKYIGKKIDSNLGTYKTFCTFPGFIIRYDKMIYLSGHECESHYKFSTWCPLKELI